MTISRRSLLCSAAAVGAAAALPALASATRSESPADFAERHLGPLDDAHREWHEIWSSHDRSVILAPAGAGMTSQLRQRRAWEIEQRPNMHVVTLTTWETDVHNPLGKDLIDLLIIESIDCLAMFYEFNTDTFNAGILADRLPTPEEMLHRIDAFLGRIEPDGKVWAAGQRVAEDDTLARLAERPRTFFAQYNATSDAARTLATFPIVLPIERVASLTRDLGYRFSELMLYHRDVMEEIEVSVYLGGYNRSFTIEAERDGNDYTFSSDQLPIYHPQIDGRCFVNGKPVVASVFEGDLRGTRLTLVTAA